MAFDRIKMPDIRKYFKKNKSGRPKFKLNSIFNLRFVLILVIIAAIMIPLCLGGIVIAKSYAGEGDRKSTRLNSSHSGQSRMPSSA